MSGPCNGSYFSPYRLAESSFEYEATFSTNCIPNIHKFGIFVFWLGIMALLLAAVLALLVREMKRTVGWNAQKKAYTFVLIWVLNEIILYSLLLSGNTTRWRYLFFPIQTILVSVNSYSLLRDWLRAISLIKNLSQVNINDASYRLSQQHLLVTILMCCFFCLCWGIGPAIFEGQSTLNWFFVFGYLVSGINTFLTSFAIWFFGRKLRKSIAPALQDGALREERTVIFAEKLDSFVSSIRSSIVRGILVCFVPLWLIASAGPGNPGLPYFFYFEFTVGTGMRMGSCLTFIWFVTMRSGTFSGSSTSENRSSKNDLSEKKAIGTFTASNIEELTSPAAAEDIQDKEGQASSMRI